MQGQHIHFVTGRLAETSLREVLAQLAPAAGFQYSIDVLGITVAALMTTDWIAPRLRVPSAAGRVMLPGYCQGDLAKVEAAAGVPAERGPRDLRRLPEHFGRKALDREGYGQHSIEILAEINHAPRLQLKEILAEAARLKAEGADVIDVGCEPGDAWPEVGEAVRALIDQGHRVSIDSMNPLEIVAAARAGAELVLSVNATNRAHAADWGCEVVAIPDVLETLGGLEDTLELLDRQNVRYRIDPVLEPIGFGFAASLGRYSEVRRRYPAAEMMMGIGNITELTDADSAAINVVLLGFCQEVGIRSVLTTEVINWARSSVAECNLARKLVHYAVTQKVLPKHVEPQLVMLRDPEPLAHGNEALERLAATIKDHNYRIFAEGGEVHAVSANLHLASRDPFELFERLLAAAPKPIDAGHAFYLGYEMAKAVTALTLAKDYRQDEALDWGLLTVEERSHRLKRAAAQQFEEGAPPEPNVDR